VVARDNHRDNDDKKGGNPPRPNNTAAGGGGDEEDMLSADNVAIGGCLCMLNEEMAFLREALAAEKHKLLTKSTHRRVAGQLLFQPL
jgi:hypothetical protein